jgi:hypothetical protein
MDSGEKGVMIDMPGVLDRLVAEDVDNMLGRSCL